MGCLRHAFESDEDWSGLRHLRLVFANGVGRTNWDFWDRDSERYEKNAECDVLNRQYVLIIWYILNARYSGEVETFETWDSTFE